jgi:hypothetical protein
MADQTVDEQIEMLSAQSEGIIGEMNTEKGKFIFGVRSFIIAMVVVVAYSVMCAVGFMQTADAAVKASYVANMQTLAFAALLWFAVSKAKSGNGA